MRSWIDCLEIPKRSEACVSVMSPAITRTAATWLGEHPDGVPLCPFLPHDEQVPVDPRGLPGFIGT